MSNSEPLHPLQEEQLWQLALQQAEATCQAPEADHQPGNEPGADARPEADALTAGDATAQEMQQQMLAGNAQPSEAPQQTAAQGTCLPNQWFDQVRVRQQMRR